MHLSDVTYSGHSGSMPVQILMLRIEYFWSRLSVAREMLFFINSHHNLQFIFKIGMVVLVWWTLFLTLITTVLHLKVIISGISESITLRPVLIVLRIEYCLRRYWGARYVAHSSISSLQVLLLNFTLWYITSDRLFPTILW